MRLSAIAEAAKVGGDASRLREEGAPVLSIIIVNFNGGVLLDHCIESIFASRQACEVEVILVDNASTDGSSERVAAGHPTMIFRRCTENLGLAKAFNQGLALARGKYLLSLDSDTRVLPGALEALVSHLDGSPAVGVAGGWLLNPDMTPQKTARRKPSALNALFGRRSLMTRLAPNNPISRRYLMEDMLRQQTPFEVDWVSTAALMARRDAVDRVGGLDEAFFVYWVDADWCARMRAAGWRIDAVPGARVIHDENLKQGRRTRRRTRMILDFHRGAYHYYRKHHVRHSWSPMHLVAIVGLSMRAGVLVAADYLATEANQLRATLAGGSR